MGDKPDYRMISLVTNLGLFVAEYARAHKENAPRFGHAESILEAKKIRTNFTEALVEYGSVLSDAEWEAAKDKTRDTVKSMKETRFDMNEVERLLSEAKSIAFSRKSEMISSFTHQTVENPIRPEVRDGSVVDPKIVYG